MSARNPGRAAEFSVLRFNGRTRPIETTPTVTTGSGQRVAGNSPDRILLHVENAGADLVTLSFTRTIVTGIGIRLAPGGTATILVEEDGEVTTWELFGMANSGTQQLYVLEEVAE